MVNADSPENVKKGGQLKDFVALHTKGIHGSHDEEAPVGGHEAGCKGESGPWVQLQLRRSCLKNVSTNQIAMPAAIRIFRE